MKVTGINEDECVQFMLSYGHNGASNTQCRMSGGLCAATQKVTDRQSSEDRTWCARVIYKVHSETNARRIIHKHVIKH
jgi:hypothetical protein